MKRKIIALAIIVCFISIANATSIGAGLTVPSEITSTLTISYSDSTPTVGQLISIYADYENSSGSDILGSIVNVSISGSDYNMIYNSLLSSYVSTHIFTSIGVYGSTINAYKPVFQGQSKVSYLSVSSSEEGSGGTGSLPIGVVVLEFGIEIVIENTSINHSVVTAGENISINLDLYNNPFDELDIEVIVNINQGNVIFNFEECYNYSMLKSDQIYYACARINLENIPTDRYSDAYLYFTVPRHWVVNNDINASKIRILKVKENGDIETIVPYKIRESFEEYNFYIQFHSFSDFLIYGEEADFFCGDLICSESENCETCPADCGECPVIITPDDEEVIIKTECEFYGYDYGSYYNICWYYFVIITIFILFDLYVIIKMFGKVKRKKEEKFDDEKIKKDIKNVKKELAEIKKLMKKGKVYRVKTNAKKVVHKVKSKVKNVAHKVKNKAKRKK